MNLKRIPPLQHVREGKEVCTQPIYTTTCECMLIGSYGDQYKPGVKEKVVPRASCKQAYEGASATNKRIGPFLRRVSDDLDIVQEYIRQDPLKVPSLVLVDVHGAQKARSYYLSKITGFLKNCKTDGGR